MKSETIYIFVLSCMVAIGEAAMKSYKGYKVLSVVPTTIESNKFLLDLMSSDRQVDFWTEPRFLGQQVDIMIGPSYLSTLVKKLANAHISYNISIDNVQKVIDLERMSSMRRNGFDIDGFNKLEDIYSWLESLSKNCPSGVKCELYSIGKSYKGKKIYAFKISMAGRGRKAYWIDATIHAREWISTATILKIMNQFVTQGDEHAIELVQKYDWYFLPVINPDGYEYTWTNDRLWRKNLKPIPRTYDFGTDLNRNFDFRWGKEGVSHDPENLEIYCGPRAESEPETRVVSAELNRIRSSVVAAVSLHSCGNMLFIPWGNHVGFSEKNACEKTEDHDELMRVADLMADAIQDTYNTKWERGSPCKIQRAVTGHMTDYAKGVSNIKYTFTAELRGPGFYSSADQIPLSYQEVYNGIVALVNATQP